MGIGSRVEHCMGHRGIVVQVVDPFVVVVRFVNTTSAVRVSDLTVLS
jgi:hypothetical protein